MDRAPTEHTTSECNGGKHRVDQRRRDRYARDFKVPLGLETLRHLDAQRTKPPRAQALGVAPECSRGGTRCNGIHITERTPRDARRFTSGTNA